MQKKAKNPVKSVERTFDLIEAIVKLDGAGVTELAAHLDLPKSTVHNYLSTLKQEGCLKKDGDEYTLSLRFLELGVYARDELQLYDVAKPEVETLAETTGELCNLMVEEHGRGVYIHQAGGEQAVEVDADVGTRVYLHGTALGKAILAHLPSERVDRIVETHGLPQATERTVDTRAKLEEELERVREQGYAIDDEERTPGVRCIAAPIKRSDDRILGAVSVAGPVNRMRGEYFDSELPTLVKETANVVELNVSYS